MKKKDPLFGFSIAGIKTEQFAVIEKNYSTKKKSNFNAYIQFKLDSKRKIIGSFLDFELLQNEKLFLKISVSCNFSIHKDSWNELKKEEKKLIIPREFAIHLAMITIGTTRGILFSKIEEIELSKFIIPLLNVESMIKSDISFNITNE